MKFIVRLTPAMKLLTPFALCQTCFDAGMARCAEAYLVEFLDTEKPVDRDRYTFLCGEHAEVADVATHILKPSVQGYGPEPF